VYAHSCGHRTAALPEKIVEISRTVANYEQYLRDLRKLFYEAYFRRTLDTRTAGRLTQAAFGPFPTCRMWRDRCAPCRFIFHPLIAWPNACSTICDRDTTRVNRQPRLRHNHLRQFL